MSFSSSPHNRTLQAAAPAEGSGLSFAPIGDVASGIAAGLRETVQRTVQPIETAWVEFLKRHEWQWFGTFTYKDAVHPEAADKQFRLWSRRLDVWNHGEKQRRWSPESPMRCIWVRGLEWQKRDVLHYHALIGHTPRSGTVDRATMELEWLTISGGFARIDQCYSDEALTYVTKYAAKGGEVDFSANLSDRPDLLRGTVVAG